MEMDNEGFLYPEIDKAECLKCGLCDNACPIKNFNVFHHDYEQKAELIQHTNRLILGQSTSGGAFTAIAEYVIGVGGVVYGAGFVEHFEVNHIRIDKIGDLEKLRNSKYVQSDIRPVLPQVKKDLRDNILVCFSGTPCQIEALLKYCKGNRDNLVLIDVVCRAVPSPGVWKKYISNEESKNGRLSSIRFRDKKYGYQYSTMVLKSESGHEERGGIESQPWLRLFFSGIVIRPSCTDCKFRSRYRRSDITIWDCFNSYSFGQFFDDRLGVSRVLIHTPKGEQIIKYISPNVLIKDISPEEALKGVKEFVYSPNEHIHKDDFFKDIDLLNFSDLIDKYCPLTINIRVKTLVRKTLNKLGLDLFVKRILKKG